MKLICKLSAWCLCKLEIFTINDIKADIADFGKIKDLDPKNTHEYGCGKTQFIPRDFTWDILNKYNITDKEYYKVCEVLKETISFDGCTECV